MVASAVALKTARDVAVTSLQGVALKSQGQREFICTDSRLEPILSNSIYVNPDQIFYSDNVANILRYEYL